MLMGRGRDVAPRPARLLTLTLILSISARVCSQVVGKVLKVLQTFE